MWESVLKKKYFLFSGILMAACSLAHSQSSNYYYPDYNQPSNYYYHYPQQNYQNPQNYYYNSYTDNNGYEDNDYRNGSDNYNRSQSNYSRGNPESNHRNDEDYYKPRPNDYYNRNPRGGVSSGQYRTQSGELVHIPDQTDWDYQESWRDYKKAYYSGETQSEAYRKSHPYGGGGIGYDPDPVYLRMEEEYKLMSDQQKQGGGTNRQRDSRNRDNGNQDDDNRSQDEMRLKAKTRGNFLRDYDN